MVRSQAHTEVCKRFLGPRATLPRKLAMPHAQRTSAPRSPAECNEKCVESMPHRDEGKQGLDDSPCNPSNK
jgi:hypothetical protein